MSTSAAVAAPAKFRVGRSVLAVVAAIVANAALSLAVVVGLTHDLGPAWYPIALAVLAYPSIRLGAAWQTRHA